MNIGTISRTALRAVANESNDNKLLMSKKIIKDLEDNPGEVSHRICQALRATLNSVADDSKAPAETIREAGSFLARVRAFDPRRQKIVEDKKREEAAKNPEPETERAMFNPIDRLTHAIAKSKLESRPVPDGYEPNFVDAVDAVARIVAKYGTSQPQWSDTGHAEVLQTALGDLVLDGQNIRQLWLSLANAHHNGAFLDGQHRRLLAHVCAFSNERKIALPTPNCFTSIREELEFRS